MVFWSRMSSARWLKQDGHSRATRGWALRCSAVSVGSVGVCAFWLSIVALFASAVGFAFCCHADFDRFVLEAMGFVEDGEARLWRFRSAS